MIEPNLDASDMPPVTWLSHMPTEGLRRAPLHNMPNAGTANGSAGHLRTANGSTPNGSAVPKHFLTSR